MFMWSLVHFQFLNTHTTQLHYALTGLHYEIIYFYFFLD